MRWREKFKFSFLPMPFPLLTCLFCTSCGLYRTVLCDMIGNRGLSCWVVAAALSATMLACGTLWHSWCPSWYLQKTVCSILWALCPSFYPVWASQLQRLSTRSVRRSLVAREKIFRQGLETRQLNVTKKKSKGNYAKILKKMNLNKGK